MQIVAQDCRLLVEEIRRYGNSPEGDFACEVTGDKHKSAASALLLFIRNFFMFMEIVPLIDLLKVFVKSFVKTILSRRFLIKN